MPTDVALHIHTATNPLYFGIGFAVLAFVLYVTGKKYESLVSITGVALSSFVVWLGKLTFAVPRPDRATIALDSYAFPSGHATLSVCAATLIVWLVVRIYALRTWKTLMVTVLVYSLAAVIIYSRIVLNVHTWTEVSAGILVGFGVSISVILVAHKLTQRV